MVAAHDAKKTPKTAREAIKNPTRGSGVLRKKELLSWSHGTGSSRATTRSRNGNGSARNHNTANDGSGS
jgi:hypothetical protein